MQQNQADCSGCSVSGSVHLRTDLTETQWNSTLFPWRSLTILALCCSFHFSSRQLLFKSRMKPFFLGQYLSYHLQSFSPSLNKRYLDYSSILHIEAIKGLLQACFWMSTHGSLSAGYRMLWWCTFCAHVLQSKPAWCDPLLSSPESLTALCWLRLCSASGLF